MSFYHSHQNECFVDLVIQIHKRLHLWFPSTRWVDCSWKSSVEFYEGVSKLTVNDEINRQNILTIKY